MENSDTGTELVIESNETEQPESGVVADTEVTSDSPQSQDTVEYELQIDDEGKPDKEPEKQPDYEMARKAYKEREEKRKKREAEEREQKELKERLERLEAENKKAAIGKPPTLADCDYDEDEFSKKTQEYYSKLNAQSSSSVEESESSDSSNEIKLSTAAQIQIDKQEEQTRSKYKQYDNDKTDLAMKFVDIGFNPDLALDSIKEICYNDGTDFTKAVIALNKLPGAFDELSKQAQAGPVAVARFIRGAAKKIQLAEKKPIESTPEPDINTKAASITNSLDKYGHFE